VPKRKNKEVVAIPPNNRAPHVLRGDTANMRTLSARYIADLQDHWEIHSQAALDEYREKFVDRYVENFSLLARVIRVEADVKRSMATPKTVDEALAELESKVGAKGRRKFEKFLREVGVDEEDEDVIDVESK
jgi:hypothetical protein